MAGVLGKAAGALPVLQIPAGGPPAKAGAVANGAGHAGVVIMVKAAGTNGVCPKAVAARLILPRRPQIAEEEEADPGHDCEGSKGQEPARRGRRLACRRLFAFLLFWFGHGHLPWVGLGGRVGGHFVGQRFGICLSAC